MDVYQWMEDVRDIVNYREVGFEEPECLEVWNKFKEALDTDTLSNVLDLIINDSQYIYCFQEEYAVVAIPIKRMQLTIADLSMGFSLLRVLEFFAFRKMEMPETKTHLLCGWRRFVIQKITFPLQ